MHRENALPETRFGPRRPAAADPSPIAREQFLRDLPGKFRELHWTLWLAEAELDGPKPEVCLDYLRLLAREVEAAIEDFE